MLKITKKEIIPIVIILFAFTLGIAFLLAPCVPNKFPTHWNYQGNVDGWSSKSFATMFFPSLILAIYVLMLLLPKFDPMRHNYQHFAGPYYAIRLALVLFLSAIFTFTLFAGIGFKWNIMYFMLSMMGSLFVIMGFALPKIKRNFFVGIRTPWTLQSDEVWEKTHQYSGKVFIVVGILSFLTMFLGDWAFPIFMILVAGAAFLTMAYSYYIYKKLGLFHKDDFK